MDIIIILISISLLMALVFLAIFIWNVKSGQYDDTVSPSFRILFDDIKNHEKKPKEEKEGKKQQ